VTPVEWSGPDGRYPHLQRRHGRSEAGRGEGHPQGLVRPVGVVFLPPRIQRRLKGCKVLERAVVVEQPDLQGLVQLLDLPGRSRRPRPGQPLGDAVLPGSGLRRCRPRSRNAYRKVTVKNTAGPAELARPKLRGTTGASASWLFGMHVTKTNMLEILMIRVVRPRSVRPSATRQRTTRTHGPVGDGITLDYLFLDASFFRKLEELVGGQDAEFGGVPMGGEADGYQMRGQLLGVAEKFAGSAPAVDAVSQMRTAILILKRAHRLAPCLAPQKLLLLPGTPLNCGPERT